MAPKPLAEYIPVRARRVIYDVLGAAFAIEAIWDVIPEGPENRIVATVAALGFFLAGRNAR